MNGAPIAVADRYAVAAGGALHVAPPGVLANDRDTTTSYLRAELVRPPAHGVATLGSYGRLRYRPDAGFTGPDTLTYRTRDSHGLWSSPAVVTIRVGAANRPPVGEGDAYQTGEDIPLEMSAPGVLANDSDPDGDDLVAEQLTGTQHGTVQLEADGSFVFDPGLDQDFDVYFTYRVGDGRSWSAPITVEIDVVAGNDPPVALDDYYGWTAGATGTVASPGVLENDYDPVEGDGLTATIDTQPATGTVTLSPDGGFTFTADPGEYRWDSFTYSACDGGGCASAQVTLEILRRQLTRRPGQVVRLRHTELVPLGIGHDHPGVGALGALADAAGAEPLEPLDLRGTVGLRDPEVEVHAVLRHPGLGHPLEVHAGPGALRVVAGLAVLPDELAVEGHHVGVGGHPLGQEVADRVLVPVDDVAERVGPEPAGGVRVGAVEGDLELLGDGHRGGASSGWGTAR